eukprot:406318-Hanusia_phi.AAC.3
MGALQSCCASENPNEIKGTMQIKGKLWTDTSFDHNLPDCRRIFANGRLYRWRKGAFVSNDDEARLPSVVRQQDRRLAAAYMKFKESNKEFLGPLSLLDFLQAVFFQVEALLEPLSTRNKQSNGGLTKKPSAQI